MLDIIFVDVLHTKIVNSKGKADRAPGVTPISWGDFALSVPCFAERFGEEVLCNYSGLWEAIHPASYFTEKLLSVSTLSWSQYSSMISCGNRSNFIPKYS